MSSKARVSTTSWRDREGVHTSTDAKATGDSALEAAIAGEMAGKIGAAQSLAHASGSLSQESPELPCPEGRGGRSLPQR